MTQEYSDEDNSSKDKRCKKSRDHNINRFILILLLCSCFIVLAIIMIGFGFATDKEDSNLGFNNSPIAYVQDNNEPIAWYLTLVNRWNYVSEDYEVELIELDNGQLIDKRIYPALQEMFDYARQNNVYPIVVSGYRTEEEQQGLMDEKIAEYVSKGYSVEQAMKEAEKRVAIAGTSEHQLGIAVDINADGIHSTGEEVYKWLSQNSYQFGFIRRYSGDKIEITGIVDEPWHYRYVGIEIATEIYNQGISFEEYLYKMN